MITAELKTKMVNVKENGFGTGAETVKLYNEICETLGAPTVKKFRDKATGEKRTLDLIDNMLENIDMLGGNEEAESKEETKVEETATESNENVEKEESQADTQTEVKESKKAKTGGKKAAKEDAKKESKKATATDVKKGSKKAKGDTPVSGNGRKALMISFDGKEPVTWASAKARDFRCETVRIFAKKSEVSKTQLDWLTWAEERKGAAKYTWDEE